MVHSRSEETVEDDLKGDKMKGKKNPVPIRRGNKPRRLRKGLQMNGEDVDLLEVQAMIVPLLERAAESGSWLACIFAPNGNRVELHWLTQEFPPEDFPACVKLLDSELKKERAKIERETSKQARGG